LRALPELFVSWHRILAAESAQGPLPHAYPAASGTSPVHRVESVTTPARQTPRFRPRSRAA
jgi:hypothetical protein